MFHTMHPDGVKLTLGALITSPGLFMHPVHLFYKAQTLVGYTREQTSCLTVAIGIPGNSITILWCLEHSRNDFEMNFWICTVAYLSLSSHFFYFSFQFTTFSQIDCSLITPCRSLVCTWRQYHFFLYCSRTKTLVASPWDWYLFFEQNIVTTIIIRYCEIWYKHSCFGCLLYFCSVSASGWNFNF